MKILPILLGIFTVFILLIRLLCTSGDRQRDTEDQQEGSTTVHHQLQSNEAGGRLVDRAPPSSTVAAGAAAMQMAAPPVRAVAPPLVCTYRKEDGWIEGSCGICLAELADGEVLRVLPACMHYFHAACVGEWLRGHHTCPLCRAILIAPAAAETN